MSSVAIIMRQRIGVEEEAVPHAVYTSIDAARERIMRIARHPNNAKYDMVEAGTNRWRIGPDYDEGFFGNKPVEFWIVEKEILE